MTVVVNVSPQINDTEAWKSKLIASVSEDSISYAMVHSWMLPTDLFSFYFNSFFVFALY